MIKRVKELLSEKSTASGAAEILAGVGIFGLSEDVWVQIIGAVVAVIGVYVAVTRDKPNADAD